MDLAFNDEQILLRDSLSAFLADHYDFNARRAAAATMPRWRPEIWSAFATQLGILGAALPEEQGGIGGGALETMIVMEELGRVLALEPWLEAIVIAPSLLAGAGEEADALLETVLSGEAIVIPAIDDGLAGYGRVKGGLKVDAQGRLSGPKDFVRGASAATHFLVTAVDAAGETGVYVVPADAPGLAVEHHALVSGKSMANLTFQDVPSLSLGARDIALALDRGVAALCAEALGIQRSLLVATVDYSKQRKQFGRPIADFQVLQHRMADMYIKVEETASMAMMACLFLDEPEDERAKAISAAKVAVDQASKVVGESAVQIHGGMGITRELPVADMFARLTEIAQELGSTEYHLRRFENSSAKVDAEAVQ
ncbi:acyl-CoA dehydrogenase family protein [Novosphingobium sp. 9U]|uniref:acyl-CoA dehydrogenase family protein n=1 Tax=Novosphingobium sp. 9U TaxID=2653158 RepID=UPI0012F2E23C|nr:acyl-CoA dehydrogenase family protein [Novosphingobium sp. 9U]VWX50579.1 Pimeloyl-CoA dehydrogenase small subunit [Novosphingobium sp. 9U]